jgi:hypothetical protein
MGIEAPVSRHKRTNLKIYIVVCLIIAIWCAYDGYFNEAWIEEHTNIDGTPQAYLVINRNAPPFLIGLAVILGAYLFVIRNRKVIADENELIVSAKEKIPYDSIQKIDKTYFASKGFFVITYEGGDGGEKALKLSDRSYDNLAAVLDGLVAKIG